MVYTTLARKGRFQALHKGHKMPPTQKFHGNTQHPKFMSCCRSCGAALIIYPNGTIDQPKLRFSGDAMVTVCYGKA